MHLSPGVELLILGGAVVAGLVGALMGLGGGVLIIPMLTALGVDIRHAIAASIIAVIATSCGAASAYLRDGLANIRIGIFLSVATTTGALLGAALNGILPTRALFFVFSVVLAGSGVSMFRKRARGIAPIEAEPAAGGGGRALRLGGRFYDPALGRVRRYVPRRPGLGFGLMLVAGAVSGLLGIGSGALKVPAMDVAMDLPIKVSTATSNFMIGITALASALVYLLRGQVLVSLVSPIALGVVAGSALGTRLLPRLKASTIRGWFVVVLAAVVTQMLVHGVRG
ncbi:MAG: sulfite exporter TauE/SafE family protein [Acidimicrobiia bacterium]